MRSPLQLTFRGMPHSDALADHLRQRAEKLDHLFDRIISCHVVVVLEGHHHSRGDRFHFSINVGLPGHELVVSHSLPEDRDTQSAIATADRSFDEAERQLLHWMTRRRQRTPANRASS